MISLCDFFFFFRKSSAECADWDFQRLGARTWKSLSTLKHPLGGEACRWGCVLVAVVYGCHSYFSAVLSSNTARTLFKLLPFLRPCFSLPLPSGSSPCSGLQGLKTPPPQCSELQHTQFVSKAQAPLHTCLHPR